MELFNEISQTIISGISIGCVYALVALGFVLIFKATEVINFAQGDMMVIGAFIAYSLITFVHFPYWAALLVTTLALGLFGTILERTILRPLVGEPPFAIIMLTLDGLLGSVSGIVVTLFAFLPSMVWRARLEEQALARRFGQEWKKYVESVPSLLLWDFRKSGK